MSAAADYVVYLLLRAAWFVAERIPLRRVRTLLEGAGVVVHAVDAHHRRVARENLAIAFPEWSAEQRASLVRDAFRNWGRIAAELVHARALARDARTLEGVRAMAERAEQLGSGGRGVLALTAHTANFELLARLLGECGKRRVFVFHRRMANRFVGDLLLRHRERMNVGTLGRGMVVREALRVLERGDILVVPLDQNQSRKRGVFVDFFGRPACTSTLLARLSLATGLAVQPAFAVWEGEALVAQLPDPIPPPPAPTREQKSQAVIELTARYTREIESAVRAHPSQWNWAHRRWKTRPEEPPRASSRAAA